MVGLQYKPIIDHMHNKNINSYFGLTLDSQGILCKTVKGHDKMFDAIVLPKSQQEYMKATQILDIMVPLNCSSLRDIVTGNAWRKELKILYDMVYNASLWIESATLCSPSLRSS